jgi:formylglycine-generating enzyme required for sulfatase activity
MERHSRPASWSLLGGVKMGRMINSQTCLPNRQAPAWELGALLIAACLLLAACQVASEPTPTPSQPTSPVAAARPLPSASPTAAPTIAVPSVVATATLFDSAPRIRATPPPAERGADPWLSPVDGMQLLPVPAGDFRMGTENSFVGSQPDEVPQHKVNLSAYWIDQTEVTQAMYQACIDDGGCTPVETSMAAAIGSGPDLPMAGVQWSQASAYCAWAGRRLPTEAEWEKAARGTDGRLYPWGWVGAPKSGSSMRLNFCDVNCPFAYRDSTLDDGFAKAAPVGQFPGGISPYGALDMAGNVWEWVADWYQSDIYLTEPAVDPKGPAAGTWKVIRGGSWLEASWQGSVLPDRTANRGSLDPGSARVDLGFRCAVP